MMGMKNMYVMPPYSTTVVESENVQGTRDKAQPARMRAGATDAALLPRQQEMRSARSPATRKLARVSAASGEEGCSNV